MKRDKLIELLGWRLGNRKNIAERAIAELDFAQEQVLEQHVWRPWFLESEFASAPTTVGERRLSLPPDFLAEIPDQAVWLLENGVRARRLEKGVFGQLDGAFQDPGAPIAYAIDADYIHLFPSPDRSFTVETRYLAKDTLMSQADVETKWLKYAGDLVLAVVGQAIAEKHLRDANQAAGFARDVGEAWANLYNKHVAQTETNLSRVMGGG